MFDWKKPTVQMLGRWQPWHKGHQALFKRCVMKTGQVVIQVRDVEGASGGQGQDDNPFSWEDVCSFATSLLASSRSSRCLRSASDSSVIRSLSISTRSRSRLEF